MAKKKLDKEAERTPSSPSKIVAVFKNETIHFVIGLMLVIFSVYLLLAFSSFFFTGAADQSIIDSGSSADLAAVNNQVKNYAGSRGAQLASYLINDCFGVSSFFILVFLAVAGLKLMRVRVVRLWKWFIGCTLLLVWFSVFFGFAFMDHYQDSFIYLGGMHGYNVSRWLISQVGVPGVWMILLITAICFFIYISARTVIWLRKLFALSFLKREKKEEKENVPEREDDPEFTTSQPQEVEFNLKRTYKQTPPPAPVMDIQAEEPEDDFPINKPEKEETSVSDESEGVTMVFEPTVSNPAPIVQEDSLEEAEPGFEVEPAASEEEYQGPELEPYNPTKDLENYRFPTIDLMKHFENDDPTIDMDEQNANKDRIINTLRSFGIEISTIKATVGPTVTLYEITPEQGVRISKIRGLEDDIALSLSADGIRIIAPIPGKGTIGIEVPNKNPKIVSGQSVIGSKKFQESKYDLPIVLGKTITNEVFMFDLCKMPHVLVAGATGQGKSVGLNAIITSLLYKKHPAELKFVLVDPKKVEFSIYSVIENHFLAKLPDGGEPIITDVTKVVQTLNSVCVEMDTRYDLNHLELEKERLTSRNRQIGFLSISFVLLLSIVWGISQRIHLNKLKRMQKELLESNEEVLRQSEKAQESEKMKTAFINSMCHEIRTPLNAINGFSNLLLDETIDAECKVEFPELIQQNTDLLTRLLNDLLEVSNLSSSVEELPMEKADICSICVQEMDRLQTGEGKASIHYCLDVDNGDCNIRTNIPYLSQTLAHLLNNANKFTESGEIKLSCHREGEQLVIKVTDTGIGIPEEKQEWVFDRFTKLDEFKPGAGLGLYICRLIVRRLGGTINIDREYTGGTRFVLVFPVKN